jgi:hypothetical protein
VVLELQVKETLVALERLDKVVAVVGLVLSVAALLIMETL